MNLQLPSLSALEPDKLGIYATSDASGRAEQRIDLLAQLSTLPSRGEFAVDSSDDDLAKSGLTSAEVRPARESSHSW